MAKMKKLKFIALFLLPIAFFSILQSCQRTEQGSKGMETASEPQPGGTVVIGTISDIDSFNEYTAHGVFSVQVIKRLFLRLMREGSDFAEHPPTFEPLLAQSWEFSKDRKEITFHLRKDILWTDGLPATAHDVRFSWLAQTSPEVAWSGRNAKEFISDVIVIDDHTVTFRFSRIYPYQLMDANDGCIIPRHVFEKVPFPKWKEHDFQKELVTDGPFKLGKYEPQQSLELVRNEGYFEKGRPYLDRIVFRIIPDHASLLMQFLSGNIDVMELIPPKEAKNVASDTGLVLDVKPAPNYTYIGWNGDRQPFNDPDIRRALTMAIDRKEIVDSFLYGYGDICRSPIISMFWAQNRNIEPLPYDPEASRKILQSKGWKDSNGDGVLDKSGKKFEFELTTNAGNKLREDILVKVQDYLGKIGVKADPRTYEKGVFMQRNLNHDFDAYIGNWIVETKVDLKTFFHSSSIADKGYNVVSYSNQDVDALIDRARTLEDFLEQKPLWDRAQEIIVAEQPYTFLFESKRINGYNRKIRNVSMAFTDTFMNLHEWWIPEDQRKP